jgi:hypothetical protein
MTNQAPQDWFPDWVILEKQSQENLSKVPINPRFLQEAGAFVD